MKFYEVDNALQEAITAAEKPVQIRAAILIFIPSRFLVR
jgi:hypothetical protein